MEETAGHKRLGARFHWEKYEIKSYFYFECFIFLGPRRYFLSENYGIQRILNRNFFFYIFFFKFSKSNLKKLEKLRDIQNVEEVDKILKSILIAKKIKIF